MTRGKKGNSRKEGDLNCVSLACPNAAETLKALEFILILLFLQSNTQRGVPFFTQVYKILVSG